VAAERIARLSLLLSNPISRFLVPRLPSVIPDLVFQSSLVLAMACSIQPLGTVSPDMDAGWLSGLGGSVSGGSGSSGKTAPSGPVCIGVPLRLLQLNLEFLTACGKIVHMIKLSAESLESIMKALNVVFLRVPTRLVLSGGNIFVFH
jgi:hypothetical protein